MEQKFPFLSHSEQLTLYIIVLSAVAILHLQSIKPYKKPHPTLMRASSKLFFYFSSCRIAMPFPLIILLPQVVRAHYFAAFRSRAPFSSCCLLCALIFVLLIALRAYFQCCRSFCTFFYRTDYSCDLLFLLASLVLVRVRVIFLAFSISSAPFSFHSTISHVLFRIRFFFGGLLITLDRLVTCQGDAVSTIIVPSTY